MSHVCGGNADGRLYCVTSAVEMLSFLLARGFPTRAALIFATYCKTHAALTISTEHIKFQKLYSLSCCYFFDVFSKCACSPHAVKNSIISKNPPKINEFITNGNKWICMVLVCIALHVRRNFSFVLEFVLSLLHRELLRTSSCFRFVLTSRRHEFDQNRKC